LNHLPPRKIHTIHGRAGPSYVIDGDFIIVVDVGFPSYAKSILNFVQNTLDRDTGDIKLIILTHSHLDHVSGVDYLIAKTNANLAAHINAKKYLTGQQSISINKYQELREFLNFLRKHNFPRPFLTDIFLMTWAGIPGIKKGIRHLGQGFRPHAHVNRYVRVYELQKTIMI